MLILLYDNLLLYLSNYYKKNFPYILRGSCLILYCCLFTEYIMLDSKLDELNSALDYLEQKNDDIHERLKELLQSNIEIRQELRNENAETSGNN